MRTEAHANEKASASPKRGVARRILCALAVILALLVVAFFVYVSLYQHADSRAQAAMRSGEGVAVEESSGFIVFAPQNPSAGLIFYPGAKVEPAAYAPLMRSCAERGVLCVVLKVPFNLAILGVGAADGVIASHPEVQTWLLGGHSMGGMVSALYLNDHMREYDGLVLLAAYSTVDLTAFEGDTLVLAGTNDHVLNWANYEEGIKKLPGDSVAHLIDGGNHAGFGDYGAQSGDGEATISHEEQQRVVVEEVLKMLAK